MAKFKPNVRFVVKSNQLKGQILEITQDKGKELYKVKWDGFDMFCHYETSVVDMANDWEEDYTFGNVANMYDPSSVEANETKGCQHIFVEYNGFTESYKYCKLCDMKEF